MLSAYVGGSVDLLVQTLLHTMNGDVMLTANVLVAAACGVVTFDLISQFRESDFASHSEVI